MLIKWLTLLWSFQKSLPIIILIRFLVFIQFNFLLFQNKRRPGNAQQNLNREAEVIPITSLGRIIFFQCCHYQSNMESDVINKPFLKSRNEKLEPTLDATDLTVARKNHCYLKSE